MWGMGGGEAYKMICWGLITPKAWSGTPYLPGLIYHHHHSVNTYCVPGTLLTLFPLLITAPRKGGFPGPFYR